MAARELIKSGEVADGRPHLTHPWVEIYPMADTGLEDRGQKELGQRLRTLAEEAGEVQSWSDVSQSFQAAWIATEQAITAVDKDSETEAAASKVVLSLVKQAVLEYDEAIEDDRFVAIHEYQDGRGFVLAARDYLEGHEKLLKQRNKEAWRNVIEVMDNLQGAWPEAVPPEKPVIPIADLYAAHARLELALAPYLY